MTSQDIEEFEEFEDIEGEFDEEYPDEHISIDDRILHEIRTFHESVAKMKVFKDTNKKLIPNTVSFR